MSFLYFSRTASNWRMIFTTELNPLCTRTLQNDLVLSSFVKTWGEESVTWNGLALTAFRTLLTKGLIWKSRRKKSFVRLMWYLLNPCFSSVSDRKGVVSASNCALTERIIPFALSPASSEATSVQFGLNSLRRMYAKEGQFPSTWGDCLTLFGSSSPAASCSRFIERVRR